MCGLAQRNVDILIRMRTKIAHWSRDFNLLRLFFSLILSLCPIRNTIELDLAHFFFCVILCQLRFFSRLFAPSFIRKRMSINEIYFCSHLDILTYRSKFSVRREKIELSSLSHIVLHESYWYIDDGDCARKCLKHHIKCWCLHNFTSKLAIDWICTDIEFAICNLLRVHFRHLVVITSDVNFVDYSPTRYKFNLLEFNFLNFYFTPSVLIAEKRNERARYQMRFAWILCIKE